MGQLTQTIRLATAAARSLDGIATRSGMLDAGLTSDDLRSLQAVGHMRKVFPEVYLVGADRLTHRQLVRAATLTTPGLAWLGARSALALRQVLWTRSGQVVLYTTARTKRDEFLAEVPMFDGATGRVEVKRLVRRPPAGVVEDLPATTVPRALVDVGALEGKRILQIAWREAEFRGLLNLADLDHELSTARRPGHDELAVLVRSRRILTDADSDFRSKAELVLLHHLAEAGLPLPEVNVPMVVNGKRYVADFFWRALCLVLELDSPDHLRPEAGARDRIRDTDFFVAGIDVIRFLDSGVVADPATYLRTLSAALERQSMRSRRAA